MIYHNKHPEWRDEDLQLIDGLRGEIVKMQTLDLKLDKNAHIPLIINHLERLLNECISDFKINHPCTETAEIPFAESMERLSEAWVKA